MLRPQTSPLFLSIILILSIIFNLPAVAARSQSTATTTATPQATHQLQGTAQAGGLATIQVTISNAPDLLSLLVRPQLPTGWTITNTTGDGDPALFGNEIVFIGSILPSPLVFQYKIQIPTNAQGVHNLRTLIEYQTRSMTNPATLYAATDPLPITLGTAPQTYTVTATAGANGTISPASQTVNYGETTTFTVTPNTGYRATVTGCGGTLSGTTYTTGSITGSCTVNATFNWDDPGPTFYTVTATAGANGTISPASQTVNYGETTTFTVTPNTGYKATVTGCGGTLSGKTYTTGSITGSCTVSATFTTAASNTHPLTVRTSGSGVVTSQPVGIDCGKDCSESYNAGTEVTVTATPAKGSTFTGWSGACSGPGNVCLISMVAAQSLMAAFNTVDSNVHLLTVRTSGTGSGVVTSQPVGIDCGKDCSESYNAGTEVTVTATPVKGSTFVGWSGACSGLVSPCPININAARSLTASFNILSNDDPATTLITHYYTSILGRAPDAAGLAFWWDLIAERQAEHEDIKPIFRQMAEFFFNSPEYLGNRTSDIQFTTDLYRTFFQREPDADGLSFWLNELAVGISRDQVMGGFLYSPEFTTFMQSLGF